MVDENKLIKNSPPPPDYAKLRAESEALSRELARIGREFFNQMKRLRTRQAVIEQQLKISRAS
jgi:hypothetical protein